MKKTSCLLTFFLIGFACSDIHSQSLSCKCDTTKVKTVLTDTQFNRIPEYDTATFTTGDFYKLGKAENRRLWYRDIEHIKKTKFTAAWNDYAVANHRTSHLDFLEYYGDKSDVELAFQFGPNLDLWAYHIFVIKKIGCCYLVTRSYFRHARFTYKAYAIMNGIQLDALYAVIEKANRQPVTDREASSFCGYFADNRNDRQFFIDFDAEVIKKDNETKPAPEIAELYDFVDKKLKWTETYSL